MRKLLPTFLVLLTCALPRLSADLLDEAFPSLDASEWVLEANDADFMSVEEEWVHLDGDRNIGIVVIDFDEEEVTIKQFYKGFVDGMKDAKSEFNFKILNKTKSDYLFSVTNREEEGYAMGRIITKQGKCVMAIMSSETNISAETKSEWKKLLQDMDFNRLADQISEDHRPIEGS